MNRSRAILALAATVAAFAATLPLLASEFGAASPWLMLLGMFYLLAIAKVAEPLFTLPLPPGFDRVRPWEPVCWRRIGVIAFGRVLAGTPLRRLNASVYRRGNSADLRVLLRQAQSAEATHAWVGLLFMLPIAWLLADRQWATAAVFVLVQVLVNIYPILHLRLLRLRLQRLVSRRMPGRDRGTARS